LNEQLHQHNSTPGKPGSKELLPCRGDGRKQCNQPCHKSYLLTQDSDYRIKAALLFVARRKNGTKGAVSRSGFGCIQAVEEL
jgi:hypothetical protein